MAERRGILNALGRLFRRPVARTGPGRARTADGGPGSGGPFATRAVAPPRRLELQYAPDSDGAPDAGEIVWTWVPYVENDGRGKDRPVLVLAQAPGDWFYAVRLTGTARDGDPDYLAMGPGPWDSRGRPSWLDLSKVYAVHARGMRREAAALDRARFAKVASALRTRYGWTIPK
ncbi:type II toxin-antitoxin system PemK/MazF family toxin [Microbacterium sp.]|jgi:hypothetical protein|uniref:type II toxin-antitoxin system PemK/MazF family toxin n=1 Tax=Microbacterium sp. TaxID=51671 RepID=UPI0037C738F1